ncbi:MAG: hypothetical protein NTW04_04350 [Elusimicrobia bacterium]|nr:hypothetical protein [Elusimicrobiota bacterium]
MIHNNLFRFQENPLKDIQLKAKYLITETVNSAFSPGPDGVNRLHIEASVKF